MSGDDRSARFEETFLPHLDAAHNLARWLTRNSQAAEDLVQEAYLRAYEHYDSFRGESARAWLLTILRNAFFSQLRKPEASGEVLEFDERTHSPARPAEDPESLALTEEDGRRLAAALEEMPEEYREVIVLRELEEMSYKEIAGVTGVPMGTVMSRLTRGRERLRRLLAAPAAKGQRT